MPTTQPRRTPEELAQLASEIFERVVRPALKAEDDGKFVAIDVATSDYEIDEDDYTAVMRLRTRHPSGEFWLERVGQPAACRIRKLR
jgi:hypothetical protein